MLSNENKQILIQHLKSLAINLGFMTVAVLADFAAHNLGLFQMDTTQAAFIGIILGQISRFANEHINVGARIAKFFRPKRNRG